MLSRALQRKLLILSKNMEVTQIAECGRVMTFSSLSRNTYENRYVIQPLNYSIIYIYHKIKF